MCREQAEALLASCLAGRPDLGAVGGLLDADCSLSLFRIVAEGLSDRFEPGLCDIYARIFSEVVSRAMPEYSAPDLVSRYERIRQPRRCRAHPLHVYVLSRVTLGADIAITSVILSAVKKRFPAARIYLVGSAKAYALWEADKRIEHFELTYPRTGTLRERLAATPNLNRPRSVVIDPDSRLTQLGLVPVCPENSYYFFESRAYGGAGGADLSTLTRKWLAHTFGTEGETYLAPVRVPLEAEGPCAAVSLGVGGNEAKRHSAEFEAELLRNLAGRYRTLVVDKGAGGEEGERVERAIAGSGVPRDRVVEWGGSFAGFVSLISQCAFYAGYDSAGQHAAAALEVPLTTYFTGFASERMLERWRPTGKAAIEIVRG